jgi:hypothetical protein
MVQCKTDPCVFHRQDEEGFLELMIACHVDDSVIAGRKSAIDRYYDEFEKHLKIERLGKMKKHLGIWWEFKQDQRGLYLEGSMEKMRLDIIATMEKCAGKSMRHFQTPGYPGTTLLKSDPIYDDKIDESSYRTIMGKIQYFQTKIGPTICNATRELASHLNHPNIKHWKALERLVGYLKYKKPFVLIIRSPEQLRGVHYCDSNYAQCEDTRRSVSGGIDTIGGAIIDWHSKKQPIVSLSTTEAELISYTIRCQAACFLQKLIKEISGRCETAVMFEDNTGCIFLIRNHKTGERTKHIDIRYFWGREMYQRKLAVPYFVTSNDNWSDGCTKNLPVKTFQRHEKILMYGYMPYRKEAVGLALQSLTSTDTNGATFGIPVRDSKDDQSDLEQIESD